MLVLDVFNLLNDALRVDKRGETCSVEEFNRVIPMVNQSVYDDYIAFFERDTESSDTLAYFKVHDYEVTLTELASRKLAYGTMPTNYYRVIGKPWTLYGTDTVFVDEVTEFEDGVREADYLTKATVLYPTCRIGGVNATNQIQIKVRPQTITSVYVGYFRELSTPFLDYYVNDTSLVKTFLAETTTAQSIPTGCTHSSGTVGGAGVTVTSLTKDLDWGIDSLPLILSKLMQKLGSALPDEGIQQTGLLEEQKING